jgi:uncharacterized membrane protein YcaP (DUF421 family)
MFDPINAFPEIILRSSIVYLAILIGFRLAGKRHISQLSLVDFALVLLVSNAVQNAMVGSDSSLTGGLVAAATLLIVNLILTRLVFKNQRVSRAIQGEARILIHNGVVIQHNLDLEEISEEEIEESVREHGIENISEVKIAVIELDGSISIVPFQSQGATVGHRSTTIQKRRRSRRGLKPS